MISIASETLIPIREAPARLPKRPNGKKLHISAVYRWIKNGVSGVVLESIRLGGCTYTSLEAMQRFADRLSNAVTAPSVVPPRAARAENAATWLKQRLGLT